MGVAICITDSEVPNKNMRQLVIESKSKGAKTLLALKFAFRTLKKENEGKINLDEFKELINDLLTNKEKDVVDDVKEENINLLTFIPHLFDHLDTDKDGNLNERELCSLGMYGSITELVSMLRTAVFYAMDKDNDGLIFTSK